MRGVVRNGSQATGMTEDLEGGLATPCPLQRALKLRMCVPSELVERILRPPARYRGH